MSALALNELQQALYAKLSGDGVLMGMISGLYDVVPQETALPYVILGDGATQGEASDADVSRCTLSLDVWTDAGGRKQALTILDRIYGLLHLGTLSLSGYDLLLMRCEKAQTSLAEEGTRLHGTLSVLVLVAGSPS
ncbi:MAG: DUF3168 domain-containing protein [Alphaproteobacteria bacterium]